MLRNPLIEKIDIDGITVPAGRRALDEGAVKALAESIARMGLKTPITVWGDERHLELVAGGHRLAAAKTLGWDEIDCFVMDSDRVSREEAEMWEISENLHRADLTKEQRDIQIRRYAELLLLRQNQVRQAVAPEIGYKKPPPQTKGIAAQIAEETGLSKRTIERVLEPPKPTSPPSNYPQDDTERSIKWRRSFERVWNDAPSLADREWAMAWIDRPIMDGAA